MAIDKKPLFASTRFVLKDVISAYADTLIVPKAFEEGQPPRYGCTLVFPSDHPGVDLINAAVDAAVIACFGRNKADWPQPLRGMTRDPIIKDCADYPNLGITKPGMCFVRCTSLEPPGIVDAALNEIAKVDLRAAVYSGRHITASLNAFTYRRVTGSGVSLGLGNIQLLQHGPRLGTPRLKPGDEFDPTELPDDDDDNDDNDGLKPVRRPRQR